MPVAVIAPGYPALGINRSLKYGQNFERANEKSTTCAYFFVTEQAISAAC